MSAVAAAAADSASPPVLSPAVEENAPVPPESTERVLVSGDCARLRPARSPPLRWRRVCVCVCVCVEGGGGQTVGLKGRLKVVHGAI